MPVNLTIQMKWAYSLKERNSRKKYNLNRPIGTYRYIYTHRFSTYKSICTKEIEFVLNFTKKTWVPDDLGDEL